MSRTRLIRPEFFTDELMASASIPTRFVYIGLWTLCDDAGYFEAKPRQIAASLFPYDAQSKRQRVVDQALADLVGMERVSTLPCGVHAIVPTLAKHGQRGGNKAYTYRDRHVASCTGKRADPVLSMETKGKGISLAVRRAAYERDQGRCRYCGRDGATSQLVFDHVDNFGSGSLSNVVVACRSCNTKKGAGTVEQAGMRLLPEPVPPSTDLVAPRTGKSSSESGSFSSSARFEEGTHATTREGRLPPFETIVGGKSA